MANISAVRNTCFALISAIEIDLRDLIEREIVARSDQHLLPTDVKRNASARYAYDHKESPFADVLGEVDLLPYMDFGDLAKLLRTAQNNLTSMEPVEAVAIAVEIEQFVPARNRVCHSRPLEEEDFAAFLDFAKMLLSTHGSLPWIALRETQRLLLEDPSFAITVRIPEFWKIDATGVRHNLPLPDYDETGFIGRSADRVAVGKHLLAAHPVITIVGEGGVGKTALAVHCLYDLLSWVETPPYEAIVWTSLKTKVLTALGVSDIKDSIASTLGIIENVARELGASVTDTNNLASTIQEILEYMGLFRILLVVDNYETVTDAALRPLLTSIPAGSKVLLTSRVGLGELEIRYKLDPLDVKASVLLLRRFAKSLNIEVLSTANDKKLERYCQHLYSNPLLIKWFVQSVSLGSDPEKLIAKGNAAFDEVLKYCFENLFSRLDNQERSVLHFLAAARRPLTPTELLFLMQNLTQIEPIDLDRAISTLHSSSMLKRTPLDGKSREGTIQLSLTDVSSDYIARFAPPDKALFEKIQQASKKLNQQIQLSSVRQAAYKFDLQAVRANTRDQRIAAFHLNTALELARARDFVSARKSVAAAKQLLPTFAEVYRISSIVESKADEPYKALQEIEEAAQLDPDSSMVRYQFANFLANVLDDYDRALTECNAAIKCDPTEGALVTLKALILTRLGRYSEAVPIYESVLIDLSSKSKKWRISTRDQAAECYRRFGEQDRTMRNDDGFRQHIERACTILDEAIAAGDCDRITPQLYTNVIEDALFFAIRAGNEAYGLSLFDRLSDAAYVLPMGRFRALTQEKIDLAFGTESLLASACRAYLARFENRIAILSTIEADSSGDRMTGEFRPAPNGNKYGFLWDSAGKTWFLIPSFMADGGWDSLRKGSLVEFTPKWDEKGRGQASDAVIVPARAE